MNVQMSGNSKSTQDDETVLREHPFPEPCNIAEINEKLEELYDAMDPDHGYFRNTLHFYNTCPSIPEGANKSSDWKANPNEKWKDYYRDSEGGFEPYTLHYHEPHRWYNQMGVLVPKNLDKSKHVYVHMHIHGGGFWSGDWRFGPWFPDFWLRHANAHNAILLLPNHVLHPYGDGTDIVASADAIQTYYASEALWDSLQEILLRLEKGLVRYNLLLSGDSAGAWIAAYMFMHPVPGFQITALCLQYGMLAHYNRLHVKASGKVNLGGEELDYTDGEKGARRIHELTKQLHDLYAKHNKGKGTGDYPGRAGFPPWHTGGGQHTSAVHAAHSSQHTVWQDIFQADKDVQSILERLQRFTDGDSKPVPPTQQNELLPWIWLYHGTQDENVPVEVHSAPFAEAVRKVWWKEIEEGRLKIRLTRVEGKGHGFDHHVEFDDEKHPDGDNPKDPGWMVNGLQFLNEGWKRTRD